MSQSTRYPRLQDILGSGSAKRAGTLPDPGPDSHPASADAGNMPVPEGPTLDDDKAKSIAARGELAVESQGAAPQDKPALTMNTETGKDGDELRSEIPVASGISDPGPDSDHPASVPTEKYASCQTAADVALVIQTALQQVTSKIAEFAKLAGEDNSEASSSGKDSKLKNSDEVPESDDEATVPVENKVASILEQLIPDEIQEDGVSYRTKMANFLGNSIRPYVAEGVERAENLAAFFKLAEMDPEAAAMLAQGGDMGGEGAAPGGPMPPPVEMAPPGVAPAGPMPGGEGGGMGAGVDMQSLEAAINVVAEQMGLPPDQVMQMILADLESAASGGGGEGGAPPVPGAGGPPAGGEAPAESSEPPAEEASEPAEEGPKEAGMNAKTDTKVESLRKLAQALLKETGRTPAEIAQGVC